MANGHDHTVECYTVGGILDCEVDNPVAAPVPPAGEKYEDVEQLRADCHATYNGGYHEAMALEAFHHGMDTICNVLNGGWLRFRIEQAESRAAASAPRTAEAETVANAVADAAQTIVDIAVRDRMQCPHRGTIEMIIRDKVVSALRSSRDADAPQLTRDLAIRLEQKIMEAERGTKLRDIIEAELRVTGKDEQK